MTRRRNQIREKENSGKDIDSLPLRLTVEAPIAREIEPPALFFYRMNGFVHSETIETIYSPRDIVLKRTRPNVSVEQSRLLNDYLFETGRYGNSTSEITDDQRKATKR